MPGRHVHDSSPRSVAIAAAEYPPGPRYTCSRIAENSFLLLLLLLLLLLILRIVLRAPGDLTSNLNLKFSKCRQVHHSPRFPGE